MMEVVIMENTMFSKYVFRLIILLSIVFFFQHLNAQDTTNFFPHHLNDLWEYYDITFFSEIDTIQIKVIFDSTDSAGNHYVSMDEYFINPLTHRIYHHYIIDTLGHVYSTTDIFMYPALIYKADAQQGDVWIILEFGAGYELAKLKKVYMDSLYGFSVMFKEIAYYSTSDTSDTMLWLWQHTDILAGGFGRVFRGGGEAISDQYLKGAVIDGVTYGDVTEITSTTNSFRPIIADRIILYPNYPNPFNGETVVRFYLPKSSVLESAIYDITGKEVKRYYPYKYPQGRNVMRWDARDQHGKEVSSGLYIWKFSGEGFSKSIKMMLIR